MNNNIITIKCTKERTRKNYTVYDCIESNQDFFPSQIRIEDDRGFSRGTGFDTWLRIKDTSSWKTSKIITGLKPTDDANIFHGDIAPGKLSNKNKSMILFKFEGKDLTIKIFLNYMPLNKGLTSLI